MYYFAIFSKTKKRYQIYVPDVFGANAASDTLDIEDAVRAIEDVVSICLEDIQFKDWPKASSLDNIRKKESEYLTENTFIMPVKAVGTKGKNIRVNLSLPDYALDIIDQDAKRAGVTRSAYIASLALNR